MRIFLGERLTVMRAGHDLARRMRRSGAHPPPVLQAVNIPAAVRRAGPERAARGTARAYLTNFICTAIGAVLGALVWNDLGWGGVGALAAVAGAVSIGFDLWGRGTG